MGKKSRRRSGSGGPVSLFPFLAVLICTMGSLILLLVVIARQARLQASERAEPDFAGLRAEIDQELEMARFHISQYDASREATERDLETARLKLGQIEDHSGQLRRQVAALKAAWEQLDRLETNKSAAKDAAEAELASLAIKIRQLEREVEEAKIEASGRTAAYSIVPYEGPHGTKRRPIYIECRADGLVLQPEGVVFGADDFDGPLDAGNPLDVALRAVREYVITQQSVVQAENEEPYPLLLVRPSGIAYFYAGRAAMKSWGTEYGYELIGDDWKLDFPEADPALARMIADVVEPARERQRRLIAAAPSRYGGGGDRPVYTVKPRGGVVSRGGGGRDFGEPSSLGLRPGGSGGQGEGHLGQQSSAGSQAGPLGRPGAGQGNGELSFFGRGGGEQPGVAAGTAAGGLAESGSHQSGGEAAGSGGEGCGQPGSPSSEDSPGRNAEAAQSLAETRGRNWGLPDANRTAVAITRPIRVECHADRLVIVPETGLGEPKTISLAGGMVASIDSFVSSVWDYMEGWGRAGRGMYWRPVLNVYLGAGADPRMAELEALLDESGLIVTQAGRLTTLR